MPKMPGRDKITLVVATNLPKQELCAIHLGRYGKEIKRHLKEELEEIDGLVGEVVG